MYANEIGDQMPLAVFAGQPQFFELDVNRGRDKLTVKSPDGNCVGLIVVGPYQRGASAQQMTVSANQTVTFGPVVDRVIVEVRCTTGRLLINPT